MCRYEAGATMNGIQVNNADEKLIWAQPKMLNLELVHSPLCRPVYYGFSSKSAAQVIATPILRCWYP